MQREEKAVEFRMWAERVSTPGGARIAVTVAGEGPALVLLPSLGRGIEDFDALVPSLVAAGLQVIRPQPRWIGESTGPVEGVTLHDLAADVAAVIETLAAAPAVIAGHAFGNYVARSLATDRPELVRGVALLAASPGKAPPGEVTISPAMRAAIMGSGDESLPTPVRLAHLRAAFFASGHDPTPWLDGWHATAKRAQRAAIERTPVEEFFAAGQAPLLDLQAEEDRVAPPVQGRFLKSCLGDRVTIATIPSAGHALLPEQPKAVVRALLHWIAGLPQYS